VVFVKVYRFAEMWWVAPELIIHSSVLDIFPATFAITVRLCTMVSFVVTR